MRIPFEEPVKAVLAHRLGAAAGAVDDRPLVVMAADRDKWNDFSKNFHADLHILTGEEDCHLRAFLVFADASRSRGKIEELLDGRAVLPFSEIDHPFCSILVDDKTYGRFVATLGLARAASALRQMHDVVLSNAEGGGDEFLELTRTADFHEAALRQERTWVALRRGARHLRVDAVPDVPDATQSFTVTADLPGLPGPYDLRVEFEHDPLFRGRIFVLVGKNGTGKTRLIRSLIDGLRAGAPLPELRGGGPAALLEPVPHFAKLVVLSSVSTDTYPRSIPPWAGLDYRYYSMIGRRDDPQDDLTMALVDCLREDVEEGTFAAGGRMDLLREMIEPLKIDSHLFVRLSEVDPPDDFGGRVTDYEGELYSPVFSPLGEQRRLRMVSRIIEGASPAVIVDGERRQLSSGELALLRFAAQATASVERGTLFLFDEPETHLHPDFISRFMSMLGRLLDLTGSAAIIATHSAYVVREVATKRVRILSIGQNGAVADQPRIQTFGSGIDRISQFVFGDSEPDHMYLRTLREWLDAQPAGMTVEQMVEQHSGELNPETMSYLARLLRAKG